MPRCGGVGRPRLWADSAAAAAGSSAPEQPAGALDPCASPAFLAFLVVGLVHIMVGVRSCAPPIETEKLPKI